jgi:CheY-like chemotaxis protein
MSANPIVYFIDDSATMREVIKIAFRRENINVVACHDAASALSEMQGNVPDIVISDVIMPEKDGYEVCNFIKQHPLLAKTPVILMSGVVNRTVAEKAFAVKADELIRKPFQPQDLIARVKNLLRLPGAASPAVAAAPTAATAALSSIFAGPAMPAAQPPNGGAGRLGPAARPAPQPPANPVAASPLAAAFAGAAVQPAPAAPIATPPAKAPPSPAPAAPAVVRPVAAAGNGDMQKLKLEISRLEILVKKLQSDLDAERQYSRALEAHVKTLQESE